MSEISALQARLAQEQSRNRELHGCLMELGSGVASAHREMSDYERKVQNTLNESSNRINYSHENIIRAHELQLEIDKLYVRFKNMELANKKIRACNNKKYYDFYIKMLEFMKEEDFDALLEFLKNLEEKGLFRKDTVFDENCPTMTVCTISNYFPEGVCIDADNLSELIKYAEEKNVEEEYYMLWQ